MSMISNQSTSERESASLDQVPAIYGASRPGAAGKRKQVTVARIAEMRAQDEKIAMLTAYDATFAALADAAGSDCILVGDSLAMVCQGATATVGVTLEEACYHTRCVSQGLARSHGKALLVADLPFGSYQQSREQAIASAIQLMQAGAHMVKLEGGGGWATDIVAFLVERGVPVCGHLGLTPQTVSALGGYRVQGREPEAAQRLLNDARAMENAGATMVVLEMVPATVAARITDTLTSSATIGIGAGNGTAGQVLVMHDMLGMNLGRMPKFVRNFMADAHDVHGAFAAYVSAVKDRSFPNNELHAW